MNFHGIYTAIVTPFLQGEIDLSAFANLLKIQKESGISGVVIAGTTGESPALTLQEKKMLVDAASPFKDHSFQIILGVGNHHTATTVSEIESVADWEIDGLLVVTPYYNKPTQLGLKKHFESVAAATDRPIILYNVPGRTAVSLSLESVLHLSNIKNIVAIKEASSDLAFAARLHAAIPELTLLSGDDTTFLPFLSIGGSGIISVLSNMIPQQMVSLYDYFQKGLVHEAMMLNQAIIELAQVCFIEVNPIPIKTALSEMGLIAEEFRLPLTQMYEPNRRLLRMAMRRLQLF